MKTLLAIRLASLICAASTAWPINSALAQTKCEPTGGIGGIRVDGELVEFETSVRAVTSDWSTLFRNRRFNRAHNGHFTRSGNVHTTEQAMEGLPIAFTSEVSDTGEGAAKTQITLHAPSPAPESQHAWGEENGAKGRTSAQVPDAAPASAVYYCLELSPETFESGAIETIDSLDADPRKVFLDTKKLDGPRVLAHARAKGIRFKNDRESIEIQSDETTEIFVRRDGFATPNAPGGTQRLLPHGAEAFDDASPARATDPFQIYIRIAAGDLAQELQAKKTFSVRATVHADVEPITFTLDPAHPRGAFDGIGGNFRLQFPDKDPQVIDYSLSHLRVAWARVAMWWGDWQPNAHENPDPHAMQSDSRFVRQMELARRFAQQHIPIIVSDWFPPAWAVLPPPRELPHPHWVKLDQQKADTICASIGNYLLYLKSHYGAEAALFSFNEPDTGVSVLMTPEEQSFWALHLGRHFAEIGLTTKFLLGDTAQGTAEATHLLDPAIASVEVRPYVGAVAFHTYRGCSDADLAAWKLAAERVHLPLLVTEASLDGAGHLYPAIFTENWFQLYEADLMTNICGKTGASTVMVWQLTADYTPLAGGGIYGDEGPLRPTMRFWFLQQLGTTPAGAFNLPISADRPRLSCAAYGDIANGSYVVHIVNTGATREATITGLPRELKTLRSYLTDTNQGLVPGPEISVANGSAHFSLATATFTTLRGEIAGLAK